MSHFVSINTTEKSASFNSRLVTAFTSFLLAFIIIAGVGFVQGPNGSVHNAAHDTRHVMSFPCH